MSLILLALAFGLPSSAAAPHPLALARETSGLTASPDARTAFFVARITGRAELWRAPSAGGWPLQLTESGSVSDPQLSPDGHTVVYAASTGPGGSDLFMIPAAGGAPQNLTRTRAGESSPRFSPDGGRLAYLSDAPGTAQVFVHEFAGPAVRALTEGAPVDVAPAWSPDGRRLACARAGEVLVLDAAGGPAAVLSTGEARVVSVSWAPRGGMLLALAETRGRRRLLLLRAGWKAPRETAVSGWDVRKAVWSDDGIVVLRRDGEGASLHLLRRTEGPARLIDGGAEKVEDFALSPDGGALLAFLREGRHSLLIARLSF